MNELVTVVIPTRDRLALLRRTLASVLAQVEVDFEVVIVDDGSSPQQAREVMALAGENVRVVTHPRSLGVAVARNRGVGEARGRWVAFLDDDDIWASRKLRAQLDAAEAAGVHWSYTGAVKFVEGPVVWQVMPPPTPERVAAMLASKCLVPAGASNVLADRATVMRLGGFDETLMHMADWDLWLRLLEAGPPASADGVAVGYRLHPAAMSLDPRGILRELEVIDRRWRHLRGGRELDAGPTHLWIGTSWLRAGHRGRAAASYLRAARTRPRQGLRGAARTLYPPVPGPARDPLTRAWPEGGATDGQVAFVGADELDAALRIWGAPDPGAQREAVR